MWISHVQQIDRQTTQATLSDDSRALSFREVIELWEDSDDFRKFFTASLMQSPFDAFFWEMPPVTKQTFDRTFEFVLVEGGSLAIRVPLLISTDRTGSYVSKPRG